MADQEIVRSNGHAVTPTWSDLESTHGVQMAAEGVADDGDSLDFMGQRFRLSKKIGLMALLTFANSAKRGDDSDDLEGLAAMYALVRNVVDKTKVQKTGHDGEPMTDRAGEPVWEGPSDWERFERLAIETDADGDEIWDFVNRALAVISARPTKRREVSSTSSPATSGRSRRDSSLPGTLPETDGLVSVADLGR